MSEPIWLPLKARVATFPPPEEGKYLSAEAGAPSWKKIPGLIEPDADWKFLGGAGQPQFKNGWGNYTDPNYTPARYRKLADGIVVMEGLIKAGTSAAVAFELPMRYRSENIASYGKYHHRVPAANASHAYPFYVYTDGRVLINSAFSFAALDGMSWWAPEPLPLTDPSTLSGLRVWLDASQLAQGDGTVLSTWPGSGGAIGGTLTGSPGPVVKAGVNGQNGLKVVRFTAGQGAMIEAAATGVDRTHTCFLVARMWGATRGRLWCHRTANMLVGWWSNSEDKFYQGNWSSPDPSISAGTTWRLYTHIGVTASYQPRLFGSGTFISQVTSPANGWGGTFRLNGYSSGETSDCEVAEMLMYDRELTPAERFQVEWYLQQKWAVPLR